MSGVRIAGYGAGLPALAVTNDDLAKVVDTSDEWISSRTGIRERRLVVGESLTDLCETAAKKALAQAGVKPEELDLIIVATLTADMPLPNASSMLQKRIGAVKATCFDISAACSGFIYALNTAQLYIRGGAAKKALVIGGEVLSKLLDWTDRTTCVLFGDGAGAAVLTESETEGILGVTTGSDGTKGMALNFMEREISHPFLKEKAEDNGSADGENAAGSGFKTSRYLYMAGPEIFKFALTKVPQSIFEVLEKTGYKAEDIDYFVLHQANFRILSSVAKRLKVQEEKFYVNLDRCGNTSAASIPMALAEMSERGMLKKGMKLVIAGFGGGLTWGAALIEV